MKDKPKHKSKDKEPQPLKTKQINKSVILGNKANEELLKQLVYQIGEGKWSEIARGLRIHGIYLEKANSLYPIWKKINPDNMKIKSKQITDLVKYAVESKGNPGQYISRWYQIHGRTNYQDDHKLISHCYNELKKILIKLVHMFCRRKIGTRKIVKPVRQLSIMKFISMSECQSETPFMKTLTEQSIRFGEMVVRFVDHYMATRGYQYEIISQVASRYQFEDIVEYIMLFDDLSKIRDRTYKDDEDLKSKSKYLESTLKANQESELFRFLYPDLQFVKYYNDAKETMNSDFVLDLEKNKNGKNHSALTPAFVEVQKNKKKTVRGRISYDNKKIFHSQQCDKFHQDLLNNIDDDYESDLEIRLQMNKIEGKELQFPPTEAQIENTIINNIKLKQKIDDLVKQVKYQAYIEHIGDK